MARGGSLQDQDDTDAHLTFFVVGCLILGFAPLLFVVGFSIVSP